MGKGTPKTRNFATMATVEPITTNAAIRRIANSPQNSQPEHRHYDTIEHVFKTSIAQARDFLFDKRLFELEMLRLEADFDVPLEVSDLERFVERKIIYEQQSDLR